jgi:hypothetical protein
MRMSEWGQNLTRTENVNRGFFLLSTLPGHWVVSQPHQVSAQGTVDPRVTTGLT